MSRQVIFNSAVLTRPGSYSKIDASQFQNILLGGNGTVGIIGDADGGPPRSLQVFSGQGNGVGALKTMFRSGDLVEAAAILQDPSSDERIPSGAQQIVVYKVNGGTKATLTKTPHVFKSLDWGAHTNNISIALSVGNTSNERVVSISGTDPNGLAVSEVSPSLGATGKFTIQYIGAGSAATMDINATALTTTVTGAVADNMTINFSDYKTLADVIKFIQNRSSVYTVASLISNAISFDPTFLDGLTAVDIKTTLTTAFARNFDLLDWINHNSSLIFDDTTVYTKGQPGPIAVFVTTPLAGGTRGTSTNTDWVNAFTALGTLRVNQVVPLASADATAVQGTYTFASILAALSSHCRLLSSTIGKNERTGWAGAVGTKTQLIAFANLTNTEAVVLSGQKIQKLIFSTNQIGYLPEWSFAATLAGMRAGAPVREPLTFKRINAQGLTQDASWDPADVGADVMMFNGVTFAQFVAGKGFRIAKCITTYTASENDAYIEESIVQIWKSFSFDLRSALEDVFTGRPGDLDFVSTVPSVVTIVAQKYADDKAITASTNAAGEIIRKAFDNIKYSLNGDILTTSLDISPTPSINFTLTTISLLPVSISG